MTEDKDGNPFNGVDQGPTNEELAANWRTGLLFAPVFFLWLIVQSLLGYGWAEVWLEQGLALWICLALVTWWRNAVWFCLTLALASLAAGRAFIAVWRE